MTIISTENLNQLCVGAAVLGSGGGGDTDLLRAAVFDSLNQFGPVSLLQVEQLQSNQLLVPVAFVGSPEATKQRGVNMNMFSALLDQIKSDYPNKSLVLMPAEIGGCNALTPFVVAGCYDLPVLDADLIGRAFPKVNMCKPAVLFPERRILAYMSSLQGECVKFLANNVVDLESQARLYAMQYGGSATIATFIFESKDVDDYAIAGSITRALSLGEDILLKTRVDLQSGFVSDLATKNINGFLYGSCVITSPHDSSVIYFQNEYLCLQQQDKVVVASPTLIVLLDANTNLPIASESLRHHMQVRILTLPAPTFWYESNAQPAVSIDQFELFDTTSSCEVET